jgi:hypothetical protein
MHTQSIRVICLREKRVSEIEIDKRSWRGAVLTNEMQLLMEPVTRFDMLSDARSFRTRIWRDINKSNKEF